VEGALASVQAIIAAYGVDHVFLLSRAKPVAAKEQFAALERYGFVGLNGVARDNVHFVLGSPTEKAALAVDLRLRVFIDDETQSLLTVSQLSGCELFAPPNVPAHRVDKLIAFGGRDARLPGVAFAADWKAVFIALGIGATTQGPAKVPPPGSPQAPRQLQAP